MGYRLNFQVNIAYVPDGQAGSATYQPTIACGPSMGAGNLAFITPSTGIAITGGNTPQASDLLTAFNAIVTSMQTQTAPVAVLTRIQNLSQGGT